MNLTTTKMETLRSGYKGHSNYGRNYWYLPELRHLFSNELWRHTQVLGDTMNLFENVINDEALDSLSLEQLELLDKILSKLG